MVVIDQLIVWHFAIPPVGVGGGVHGPVMGLWGLTLPSREIVKSCGPGAVRRSGTPACRVMVPGDVGGPSEELAFVEQYVRADERHQMRRVDGPPPGLGGLDRLVGHRDRRSSWTRIPWPSSSADPRSGDNWLGCGSTGTPDGSADPQRQVTVMNVRVAALVADGMDRVPLAGDQLYVDLDLSVGNLPAGSLLAVGQAVLQVSEAPHLGCAKFVERFGAEAMRFVNSRAGRQLRLRGMNTRVVEPVSSARVTLPPRPRPADRKSHPGNRGQAPGMTRSSQGSCRDHAPGLPAPRRRSCDLAAAAAAVRPHLPQSARRGANFTPFAKRPALRRRAGASWRLLLTTR